MILSLVAALDETGGIGKNGKLPWHLRTDLKRFKSLTWGHHVVMGRATFKSIGKALPGRTNIIVTRQRDFRADGCLTASSLESAIGFAKAQAETETFVIGGGQIFRQALPLADRLYLTRVHARLECDVYFPALNQSEWNEIFQESFPADEENDYPTTYFVLERQKNNI